MGALRLWGQGRDPNNFLVVILEILVVTPVGTLKQASQEPGLAHNPEQQELNQKRTVKPRHCVIAPYGTETPRRRRQIPGVDRRASVHLRRNISGHRKTWSYWFKCESCAAIVGVRTGVGALQSSSPASDAGDFCTTAPLLHHLSAWVPSVGCREDGGKWTQTELNSLFRSAEP